MLLDTVPLTDPLITAESLVTGYLPEITTIIGALVIVIFYAIVASKAFCSWVCPMNMVTDAAAWLRRKLGIRQSLKISRQLRYVILAVILVGSAITGNTLMGVDKPSRSTWTHLCLWNRRNPLVGHSHLFI